MQKPSSDSSTASTNSYPQMVETYYRQYLPHRLALIPPSQREAFYRNLGMQMREEVETRTTALLSQESEETLSTSAAAEMAARIRSQVSDQVVFEMLYSMEPEEAPEDADLSAPEPIERLMDQAWAIIDCQEELKQLTPAQQAARIEELLEDLNRYTPPT